MKTLALSVIQRYYLHQILDMLGNSLLESARDKRHIVRKLELKEARRKCTKLQDELLDFGLRSTWENLTAVDDLGEALDREIGNSRQRETRHLGEWQQIADQFLPDLSEKPATFVRALLEAHEAVHEPQEPDEKEQKKVKALVSKVKKFNTATPGLTMDDNVIQTLLDWLKEYDPAKIITVNREGVIDNTKTRMVSLAEILLFADVADVIRDAVVTKEKDAQGE